MNCFKPESMSTAINFGQLSDKKLKRNLSAYSHFRAGLSMPIDKNASTHLIRNALGGTDYGIDNSRLFHLLSLPPDVVRMFRDDITITILQFDSEYLRNLPA